MTHAPKIYEPEYYRVLHELEGKHWWSCGMRDIAAAVLDSALPAQAKSLRILDAGCGTGVLLEWLERYESAAVHGIDISAHALQYCRDRGRQLICRSSVVSTPFLPGAFDLIACNDVLQHVPSQDTKVLAEFLRLLKPGGLLYLRTNARQHWTVNQDVEHDYIRYTPGMVEEKAQQAGFRVIRSTYANAMPSLLADLRNLLRSRKRSDHHHDVQGYSGLQLRIPPLGLNSLLRLYLRAEAFLLGIGLRIPFGHSLHFILQKPV